MLIHFSIPRTGRKLTLDREPLRVPQLNGGVLQGDQEPDRGNRQPHEYKHNFCNK
jgi:hypothetical protein